MLRSRFNVGLEIKWIATRFEQQFGCRVVSGLALLLFANDEGQVQLYG